MKVRPTEKDVTRAQRAARDIEIIHRNADHLNADALDALEDQAPIDFDEDAP